MTDSCARRALSLKAGFCRRRIRRWPASSASRMLTTPVTVLFHHCGSFSKLPVPSLLGKPYMAGQALLSVSAVRLAKIRDRIHI